LSADLDSNVTGGERPPGESAQRANRILEAKYLDWCSARLADRFLRLTPDEIYDLAQEGSPEGAVPPGELASLVAAMHRAWSDASAAAGTAAGGQPAAQPGGAGQGRAGGGAATAGGNAAAAGDDAAWPAPAPAAAAEAPGRHTALAAYRAVVARVAVALAARVGLPAFEEWAAAYREDPERFDPELVGFWRDEA
jgi:hypothetical protein